MIHFLKPSSDKEKTVSTEAKIHEWLKNNRRGYNAERWGVIIENHSRTGEFTVILPPEKDQILTSEELEGMITGPLPDEWNLPQEPI